VKRAASLVVAALALGWVGSAPAETGKKDAWFADKATRSRVARRRAPARPPAKRPPPRVVTLKNLWTHEALPVTLGRPPRPAVVDEFLRCHHNHERRAMDRRLLALVLQAARTFRAHSVEIVSGYRSPAYNAFLRSQGRQVAKESQHLQGRAVDFRLPEVPTDRLVAFVKAQGLGGVGYYPSSKFVHADTGPVRFWRGR
jgi:uncharacterized protein YcbK (DUF882 family)